MIAVKPIYETLIMRDGVTIQTAKFEPATIPLGVVQVIHGFGEHIERYAELATVFAEHRYACVIHDQRGHGERQGMSERQRAKNNGIVSGYESLLDDVGEVRKKIGKWYPDLPVTLYGHSMGGNIAANVLLKRTPEDYCKAVLETPWLRLYAPPSGFVVWLAKVLGAVSGSLAITNPLKLEIISRDPETVKLLRGDPYYHNRLSFRLFTQITAAGEYAVANAGSIRIPTLLLCAGGDQIVSPVAIRAFAANAGENVTFKEYPDGYHSLHSDINRSEVLETMLTFL